MRFRLSARFKNLVRNHDESQGALGARAGIDVVAFSNLMNDQRFVGPTIRLRLIELGDFLGLNEDECFVKVQR